MNFPRRAGLPALALLMLVAAALAPGRAAAQSETEKRAASPNGKIIFQSTQGGDGFVNDIYVMEADGKHQTRLTDDPGDDVSAQWSPQGTKVAFLSNRRGGGYELYLMNADGSNQRPLRETAPVINPSSFEWSPDGMRLAYATTGGDVYVIEVTSGGEDSAAEPVHVSVNKPDGSSDSAPSWSPEGARLVVRNSTTCNGCSNLVVVTVVGGARAALSTGPGFDDAPSWSPDGSLIAYEGDRGGRGIYVTASDGTGVEVKVSGGLTSSGGPAWSPAGSRLAFRAETSNVVYVVNGDGSGLTSLCDVPASSGNIFWSPDGSKVAFHNANDLGWVDMFVVESNSTGRRAANYTKSKRADEFGHSWQKIQ